MVTLWLAKTLLSSSQNSAEQNRPVGFQKVCKERGVVEAQANCEILPSPCSRPLVVLLKKSHKFLFGFKQQEYVTQSQNIMMEQT